LENATFSWGRPLLILAGVTIRTKGCLKRLEVLAGHLLRPQQLARLLARVPPPDRSRAPALPLELPRHAKPLRNPLLQQITTQVAFVQPLLDDHLVSCL